MLESTTIPVLHPTNPHSFAPSGTTSQIISYPERASSPARQHQRSHTATDLPPLVATDSSETLSWSPKFFPFLKHSRDRSISPKRISPKEAAEFEVDSQSSRECSATDTSGSKNRILSSWFNGTSDPVNISLVPSSSAQSTSTDNITGPTEMWGTSGTTDNLTQPPSVRTQKRPDMSSASSSGRKFSFFRKTPQTLEKQPKTSSDELANLDIHSVLYPSWTTDEFSPAAFKNLQINAERTIRRFQTAYRENLRAFNTLCLEKQSQAEDLEEARTRSEHLKLQLAEMAERAVEQETALEALRKELEAEQQKRFEEQESRRRTIKLLPGDVSVGKINLGESVPRSHLKKRVSDASSLSGSELDSSSADSVFSEPLPGTLSPASTAGESPVLKHVPLFPVAAVQGPRNEFRHSQARRFDCTRCRATPSEAWLIVDTVQAESKALKERISELEAAHEDALDFLNGIKMEASV